MTLSPVPTATPPTRRSAPVFGNGHQASVAPSTGHRSRLPSPGLRTGWPTAQLEPTKLDRLAARAIAAAVAADGTCDLGDYHGLVVLGLATECLDYSAEVLATQRGQGNLQRLCGALFTYQRYFVPDRAWRLVESNDADATLTWVCTAIDLPPVVDHITRTTALAAVQTLPPTAGNHTTPTDPTVGPAASHSGSAATATGWTAVQRACDLVNAEHSLLRFPDEVTAVRWCRADDPISSRELAFPAAIYGDHPGAGR